MQFGLQIGAVLDLEDTHGKRTLRQLQHHRVCQFRLDTLEGGLVGVGHHQGARGGDLVVGKCVVKKDLVAAAQDGSRIVNRHQTFLLRPAGQPIGQVVD